MNSFRSSSRPPKCTSHLGIGLVTVGVLCVVVLFGIVASNAIDWLLTRGDSAEAQVAPVDSLTLLPTAMPFSTPGLVEVAETMMPDIQTACPVTIEACKGMVNLGYSHADIVVAMANELGNRPADINDMLLLCAQYEREKIGR